MMENKILVAKNVTKIYGVGTKNPYTALSAKHRTQEWS